MADNMNVTTEFEKAEDIPSKARRIVYSMIRTRAQVISPTFGPDEVYVVWFCFILGGWKALISTTLPDGRYYEVTYDKAKARIYLDTYEKIDNLSLPSI